MLDAAHVSADNTTTPMLTPFNPNAIETTDLQNLTFTVVDIETTGGKPLFHQIIEIGIVKIEKGEITDTFETFVNPGHPIPPDITMITGITDNDVEYAPIFPDVVDKIMPYLNQGIFVAHNVGFDYGFVQKSLYRAGVDWHAPKLCTVQLSRKLLPHLPRHNLDALAKYFHINIERRHRALDDARATGIALTKMCQILVDNGINALSAITRLTKRHESDKYQHLKPTIDALPYTPGVYLMKNKQDQIIYIGKSKCLHKRVRSYFYEQQDKSKKLERLVAEVKSIEHICTGSELSALLLESQKIKEHLPIFNKLIRNYKAYPFLKFTNEAYPRLVISRDVKSDGAAYYGPFKSTAEVSRLIEQLQKTFGIRPCKTKLNPKKPESFKTCLDVELGYCTGACTGKLPVIEYATFVKRAQNFLEGNGNNVIEKLQQQIDQASQKLEFEKAAELRDKLIILERLHNNRAKIAQAVHHNNVVIVQPGTDKGSKEIFLIKNGILLNTIDATYANSLQPDYDELPEQQDDMLINEENNPNITVWREALKTIYETETHNIALSKTNIDELMIIATWLMQHTDQKEVFFITPHTLQNVTETLGTKYTLESIIQPLIRQPHLL